MKCDFDINKLKFDEKGLIPAIVTDNITKEVLTLAYMNRESLEKFDRKGAYLFLEPFEKRALDKGRNKRKLSAHCVDYRRLRLRRVKRYCRKGRSCLPYGQ